MLMSDLGGNPPNHLEDFYEGIRIRALISRDQCGPCVVLWKKDQKKCWGTFRKDCKFLEVRETDGGVMENVGMCCIVYVILMKRWSKDLMFLAYLYSIRKCDRQNSLKLNKQTIALKCYCCIFFQGIMMHTTWYAYGEITYWLPQEGSS